MKKNQDFYHSIEDFHKSFSFNGKKNIDWFGYIEYTEREWEKAKLLLTLVGKHLFFCKRNSVISGFGVPIKLL